MRTTRVLLFFLVLMVLLLIPSVASAMTYDQATDKLFADGYPQAS